LTLWCTCVQRWTDIERSKVKVIVRLYVVMWALGRHFLKPVSGMHGHISMKLITDMTWWRLGPWIQRSNLQATFCKNTFFRRRHTSWWFCIEDHRVIMLIVLSCRWGLVLADFSLFSSFCTHSW